MALYQNEYYGANFTHFTELLDRHENIHVSVSSVASILEAAFILSPMATRAKRKRIRRKLEAMKSNTKSKKKQMEIQTNLVAAEDAHSRRPRHAYFGEQLQGDATPYEWVPGKIWHLHLFIDDATGIVTGGYFDTQETLNGYYHVLWQTLKVYGIPVEIFTDKRTVFIYKQKDPRPSTRIPIRSSVTLAGNWGYTLSQAAYRRPKAGLSGSMRRCSRACRLS